MGWKPVTKSLALCCAVMQLLSVPAKAEEQLTVVTYYPAPHAVARALRLHPTTAPDCSRRGTMYYDGGAKALYICNGTTGIQISSGTASLWDYKMPPDSDGDPDEFINVLYQNTSSLNVSIADNTTSAASKLEIDGGFFRNGAGSRAPDGISLSSQVNLGGQDPLSTQRSVAGAAYSTVSGGAGNSVYDCGGTVSSGRLNSAAGNYSTVTGGLNNTCGIEGGQWRTIGGGQNNAFAPYVDAEGATISGGNFNSNNNAASSRYAVISGGLRNCVRGDYAVATGGDDNLASGAYSAVTTGESNTASGLYAVVTGGELNIASGNWSSISMGLECQATGNFSWAGGYMAIADKHGAFVWTDYEAVPHYANAQDSFNIRAHGGFRFIGAAGPTAIKKVSDVAEFIDCPAASELKPGEIASLVADRRVDRSAVPYDAKMLGVVSGKDTCSFYMGEAHTSRAGTRRVPVSLAGPVYVSVSDEAGPIAIGDPITSSRIPGVGMRAQQYGRIVGYAMQEEPFSDSRRKDILVFVSAGYHLDADIGRLEERAGKAKQRLQALRRGKGAAP